MGGLEGRQSGWVREFGEALGRRRVAGALLDERLTSVEAPGAARERHHIEKRAAAVDRLSAVILLQSYLDSRTARPVPIAYEIARRLGCWRCWPPWREASRSFD